MQFACHLPLQNHDTLTDDTELITYVITSYHLSEQFQGLESKLFSDLPFQTFLGN